MPTATSPRRESRLGALDFLRFGAAAVVLAFHFTARDSPAWGGQVPDSFDGVASWSAYGRMGVQLFFVISGFVILMSSWGKSVPSFVASRVGRLYPAYWASVVISVGVIALWPTVAAFFGHDFTASDVVLNLTMVQMAFGIPDLDGAYWTLWYEARFYLLIALLMLAGGLTRTRVLAFATLWPIAGALAAGSESTLLTTLLMPDYAAFFAGGMLLYVLYRDGHDWGVWLLLGLQGAVGLHFSLSINMASLAATTHNPPSPIVVAVLTFLCFGLVALTTLTPVARWNAGWMTFAGALTYPLYLIHGNLGFFVIAKTQEPIGAWGAVAAATVVCLIVSVLLYRLVEKPFGPMLRRLTLSMLQPATRGAEAKAAAPSPMPAPAASPSPLEVTGRSPRLPMPPRPHARPVTAAVPTPRAYERVAVGTSSRG